MTGVGIELSQTLVWTAKNKRCLSESVSEWQGHLLSCQVTAKNHAGFSGVGCSVLQPLTDVVTFLQIWPSKTSNRVYTLFQVSYKLLVNQSQLIGLTLMHVYIMHKCVMHSSMILVQHPDACTYQLGVKFLDKWTNKRRSRFCELDWRPWEVPLVQPLNNTWPLPVPRGHSTQCCSGVVLI